jgi:hypothetical protein
VQGEGGERNSEEGREAGERHGEKNPGTRPGMARIDQILGEELKPIGGHLDKSEWTHWNFQGHGRLTGIFDGHRSDAIGDYRAGAAGEESLNSK